MTRVKSTFFSQPFEGCHSSEAGPSQGSQSFGSLNSRLRVAIGRIKRFLETATVRGRDWCKLLDAPVLTLDVTVCGDRSLGSWRAASRPFSDKLFQSTFSVNRLIVALCAGEPRALADGLSQFQVRY